MDCDGTNKIHRSIISFYTVISIEYLCYITKYQVRTSSTVYSPDSLPVPIILLDTVLQNETYFSIYET